MNERDEPASLEATGVAGEEGGVACSQEEDEAVDASVSSVAAGEEVLVWEDSLSCMGLFGCAGVAGSWLCCRSAVLVNDAKVAEGGVPACCADVSPVVEGSETARGCAAAPAGRGRCLKTGPMCRGSP